jgi:hypothetical protein
MIHWLWLIPALLVGAFLGFLTMALCVMSRGPDEGTD